MSVLHFKKRKKIGEKWRRFECWNCNTNWDFRKNGGKNLEIWCFRSCDQLNGGM